MIDPAFFQPHKSGLTRNLSLVPDNMLMNNRNKKVKESDGNKNEESGKYRIMFPIKMYCYIPFS